MMRRSVTAIVSMLLASFATTALGKVTQGSVMVERVEVRLTPERDSPVIVTLGRGRPVLLSKVPPAPPGWMHVMFEEADQLRHGYVPLGSIGVLTVRTSNDAYASALDGASFPEIQVTADLISLKCKRVPRSLDSLESCLLHYAVRLRPPSGFDGGALVDCSSTIEFVSSDGTRSSARGREQLQITSGQGLSTQSRIEIGAPAAGSYTQAGLAALECRLDKVGTH